MSEFDPAIRAVLDKYRESIADAHTTADSTRATIASTQVTLGRSRAILAGTKPQASQSFDEARFAALLQRCSPLGKDILTHFRGHSLMLEAMDALEKVSGELLGGDVEEAMFAAARKRHGEE